MIHSIPAAFCQPDHHVSSRLPTAATSHPVDSMCPPSATILSSMSNPEVARFVTAATTPFPVPPAAAAAEVLIVAVMATGGHPDLKVIQPALAAVTPVPDFDIVDVHTLAEVHLPPWLRLIGRCVGAARRTPVLVVTTIDSSRWRHRVRPISGLPSGFVAQVDWRWAYAAGACGITHMPTSTMIAVMASN